MDKKVENLLQSIFSEEVKWKVKLLDNWHKVIGPMGAKVTLLHIKEPTIVLGVTHPAWAQELHMLKAVIQRNINTFLGQEYIKNIVFQVTPTPKAVSVPATPLSGRRGSPVDHRSLTVNEENALQNVHDDGLKDALRRYLAYCIPLKK